MYKFGQIVLIKMHPSSGNELSKFRPALVLHSEAKRNFITFAPFTSQAKIYTPQTEFMVKPTNKNGLEKPSLLLCWYIQTVGVGRVQKSIGLLDKQHFQKIVKAIQHLLPL